MAKKIITYIISFFLTICIFILMAFSIASNTILNKQFMLATLDENDYYKKVYYDIKDDFEEGSISAGVDAAELQEIYDIEKVTADIKYVIDGIYENKELKIDTSSIVDNIDKIIYDKLEQNNRTPSAGEKKSIQTFEESLANMYVDNIAFSEKYVGNIADVFNKINGLSGTIWTILIVILIVMIIIVILLNRNIVDSVKPIATSLVASGILGVAVKLLIEAKVQNILILSAAFSKTLVYALNVIIGTFFTIGIVLCVIGVLFIILSSINANNKREA